MNARLPITSGAVWHATDLGAADTWTIHLDDAAQCALVATATAAQARGESIESLSRDTLSGPAIDTLVDRVSRELQSGRGFVLLRGFPIDELDASAIELAYAALGWRFGTPVSQDAQGTLLGHVLDRGVPRTSPAVRRYATNERQDFHTDGADIIGLLCLQRARRGGESRLVSAAAVYNEILRRDPHAIDVLYEPMCWDRNDEQSPGEDPFYALPVLHDVEGRPRFFYIGWYIRDAQRHPAAPRLRADQLAAMELIETVANDPAFYIEMDFQPGDVQLLNNSVILHSREAYDDHPEPHLRRHLLRLWLAAHDFAAVEATLRGGIPTRRE